MSVALALLFFGLALSAFFSGSETGFYRATRVRLVIDALDGDWISGRLLWLANNPALFVATTLVGNNIANYMTSFGVVLLTRAIAGDATAAELGATVLFSPIVFVYGELLPKYLFYNAPNLLLRRGGPVFLFFAVVFAPISAVLWTLGLAVQTLTGETPLRIRLALARKELQEAFEEGHEAGILRPAQRDLAQNLFAIAARPLASYCRPAARVVTTRLGAAKDEVLRLAGQYRAGVMPVSGAQRGELEGYLRVVDLYLGDEETVQTSRPLMKLDRKASPIHALVQLQSEKEELAVVVDEQGRSVGLLYADDLARSLIRGTT
ncbi:MAG: DUF21 domain-containing protein [Planctomycetes bacterium]|nr:DUF21 domain-containing protein [Planctomycetota bacterium]MBL7037551.1 DUF21 domain-containing protein [Pirellulaceae bacterium]